MCFFFPFCLRMKLWRRCPRARLEVPGKVPWGEATSILASGQRALSGKPASDLTGETPLSRDELHPPALSGNGTHTTPLPGHYR